MGKRYFTDEGEKALDAERESLSRLLGVSATDTDALLSVIADARRYRQIVRDQSRKLTVG